MFGFFFFCKLFNELHFLHFYYFFIFFSWFGLFISKTGGAEAEIQGGQTSLRPSGRKNVAVGRGLEGAFGGFGGLGAWELGLPAPGERRAGFGQGWREGRRRGRL